MKVTARLLLDEKTWKESMNKLITASERQGKSSYLTLLLVVSGFIVLLSGLLFAAGVNGKVSANVEARAPHVVVNSLSLQDHYESQVQVLGVIESAQDATLGFELAGQLAAVYVEDGDKVQRGDVLAQLDTARLVAQQQELKASLASAQAQAKLAGLSAQRIAELVKQGLESTQTLDEAISQRDANDAQVSQVTASLASLQVELDKSRIVAPFDGRIATRMLDQGTVVNSGQAVFRLLADSQIDGRFAMPAKQAKRLSVGTDLPVAFDDKNYQARVIAILPQRQRQTRTVDVLMRLHDAEGEVVPGDLVTVNMTQDHAVKGMWVPLSALEGGTRGLWTLYTVSSQGLTELQPRGVEIVYSDGVNAYVRGALATTELTVVEGVQRFVPHQQVLAKVPEQLASRGQ